MRERERLGSSGLWPQQKLRRYLQRLQGEKRQPCFEVLISEGENSLHSHSEFLEIKSDQAVCKTHEVLKCCCECEEETKLNWFINGMQSLQNGYLVCTTQVSLNVTAVCQYNKQASSVVLLKVTVSCFDVYSSGNNDGGTGC